MHRKDEEIRALRRELADSLARDVRVAESLTNTVAEVRLENERLKTELQASYRQAAEQAKAVFDLISVSKQAKAKAKEREQE